MPLPSLQDLLPSSITNTSSAAAANITTTTSKMSLQGKVAVVTGGSKGIGAAIALRLGKEGASVVVNYSRDEQPALDICEQIGKDRAIAIKANVGVISECQRLLDESIEKFGKVDILICSAGVLSMVAIDAVTEENYNRFFDINVKGPLFLVQHAAKTMAEGGRIVLFSTSTVVNSNIPPGYLLYNATKGAIEQITKCCAKSLGPRKININTMSPGPVDTELFRNANTEQSIKMITEAHPQKRVGKPEEIANVVAFLVSEEASWVNGANIRANGGFLVAN